jgi:uncharacterized membrane protein
MVRRQRRWVAGLVMLGVIFAQFITVAHACTLTSSASLAPAAVAQEPDQARPSDCAAMAKRVAAEPNACESHCAYGQQIDVQFDSPVAAIPPQPALTVRIISSIGEASVDTISLQARSTARPVSLLFSRLLI